MSIWNVFWVSITKEGFSEARRLRTLREGVEDNLCGRMFRIIRCRASVRRILLKVVLRDPVPSHHDPSLSYWYNFSHYASSTRRSRHIRPFLWLNDVNTFVLALSSLNGSKPHHYGI